MEDLEKRLDRAIDDLDRSYLQGQERLKALQDKEEDKEKLSEAEIEEYFRLEPREETYVSLAQNVLDMLDDAAAGKLDTSKARSILDEVSLFVLEAIKPEQPIEREIARTAPNVEKRKDTKSIALENMLSDPQNHADAIVTFKTLTGRDSTTALGNKMFEAYKRFCSNNGLSFEVIYQNGTSAVAEVRGTGAYGLFRNEEGSHRFRYMAEGKEHKSLLAISVEQEKAPAPEVKYNDKDFEVEYFAASTPGGQNANKTQTGVKITHIPTHLTARTTSRSRQDNLEKAKAVLLSMVSNHYEEKARNAPKRTPLTETSSPIRVYTLTGHQFIRDKRTEVRTTDTDSFFRGNLEDFLYAPYRATEQK